MFIPNLKKFLIKKDFFSLIINNWRQGYYYEYTNEYCSKRYYVNDKLHGKAFRLINEIYYFNTYINGKLHGKQYHYLNNDMYETDYILGNMLGMQYRYLNGKLIETWDYKQGKNNYDYKKFHPNGLIMIKAKYGNDMINGKYLQYNSKGKLIKNEIYYYGKLVHVIK